MPQVTRSRPEGDDDPAESLVFEDALAPTAIPIASSGVRPRRATGARWTCVKLIVEKSLDIVVDFPGSVTLSLLWQHKPVPVYRYHCRNGAQGAQSGSDLPHGRHRFQFPARQGLWLCPRG